MMSTAFRMRMNWNSFVRVWFALTGVDLGSKIAILKDGKSGTNYVNANEPFDFIVLVLPSEEMEFGYRLRVEGMIKVPNLQYADPGSFNWVRWDLGSYELPYPEMYKLNGTPFWNDIKGKLEYEMAGQILEENEHPFKALELDYRYQFLLLGLGKLRQGNIQVSQFVKSLSVYGFKCDNVKLTVDGISGEPMFQQYEDDNPIDSMRSVLKHIDEFKTLTQQ